MKYCEDYQNVTDMKWTSAAGKMAPTDLLTRQGCYKSLICKTKQKQNQQQSSICKVK